MAGDIELVAVADAPLGRGDATRRFGLRLADGAVCFKGLTRPEGTAAAPGIARVEASGSRALVAIPLPALLSEGAGPHLLDSDGRVVIALGEHPRLGGRRVAMGEPAPGHRLGLVADTSGARVWCWVVRATVAAQQRVAALDELDACADDAAAWAWQARWAGTGE